MKVIQILEAPHKVSLRTLRYNGRWDEWKPKSPQKSQPCCGPVKLRGDDGDPLSFVAVSIIFWWWRMKEEYDRDRKKKWRDIFVFAHWIGYLGNKLKLGLIRRVIPKNVHFPYKFILKRRVVCFIEVTKVAWNGLREFLPQHSQFLHR